MRIADLTVGTGKVRFIGDPHLGRVFKTGVPLHRRGEREEMVWATFEKALTENTQDIDAIVIMGDLFDKMHVPNAVVLRASDLLWKSVGQPHFNEVVVLRGNHDASRDTSIRSSFDVLMALHQNNPDVEFVTEVTPISYEKFEMIAFGWHPFITAKEMVERVPVDGSTYDAALGPVVARAAPISQHELADGQKLRLGSGRRLARR